MPSETAAGPPLDFQRKMEMLLGEEFAAFAASYDTPHRVGLRVNTLKTSVADFISKSPFPLTPVGAYEPAGFAVSGDARPGAHPYHAAGLYYLQEPAAMAAAALLAPQPGELVLDLAAAPGGKATHLISLMKDQGLLVANDVNAGRARLLAENMERWGPRRVLITQETPERLAAQFGPIFDRVLLDAPCSGEGMFRREGAFEWSENMVLACARRQDLILGTAAGLVRPGGRLLYATCTFSPEENEGVIAAFLAQHPDFALLPLPQQQGFAPGHPEWSGQTLLTAERRATLQHAVRLWPHRFAGEGHFIALLQRDPAGANEKPLRLAQPEGQRDVLAVWERFAAETLAEALAADRLHVAKDRVYLLPELALDTGRLRLVRYGLLLGEARKGYFRPAHTLALSLSPAQVHHTVNWSADDERLSSYLRGHDLPDDGPDGWVLVAMEGHALGWAKRVQGRLKNHYPRGLRRP